MKCNFKKLFVGLVLLQVLFLTGCWKSAPQPNPQIGDTVIKIEAEKIVEEQSISEKEEIARKIKQEEILKYGIYGPEDVECSVFFEFDRAKLNSESKATLDALVAKLKKESNLKILIFGHCDWFGTPTYNLNLGKKRAESIRTYVTSLGIAKNRTEIFSYSNEYAQKGLMKESSKSDRRADIILIR